MCRSDGKSMRMSRLTVSSTVSGVGRGEVSAGAAGVAAAGTLGRAFDSSAVRSGNCARAMPPAKSTTTMSAARLMVAPVARSFAGGQIGGAVKAAVDDEAFGVGRGDQLDGHGGDGRLGRGRLRRRQL